MKWVETSREGWKGFNHRKCIGDFVKCFGRALPFEKEEQVKLGWGDCGEKVNTGGGKPGQRREWRSGDANCGTNANCASKNLSKGGVEKSAKSANIVSVGNSEHKHVLCEHCIHICNTSTTPTHPKTGPAHYICTICIAVQCTEFTFTQRVCLTLVSPSAVCSKLAGCVTLITPKPCRVCWRTA